MIVLTGATGFVGSELLRRLCPMTDLLVVSRNVAVAQSRFPNVQVCDYESLSNYDLTDAVFVHLAARNNDRAGEFDEFRRSNVDCLMKVASLAKEGGARRFINLCSTHALDPQSDDFYGLSKREGAHRLSALWPHGAINLYVPAIYGDRYSGRLAALSRLPAVARPIMLRLVRQVRPVMSIDNLLPVLLRLATQPAGPLEVWQTEQYAADPIPRYGIYAVIKRSVDLIAAVTVLVLAWWIMALIAIYVRLDSEGPALFAQERVGRRGRVFNCYKFRTMALGTEHAATHDVSVTAVTRAGRFLRRTKLDELPQIINVLRNDMSLVGPRPCLPMQRELVLRRRERGVLRLKPGITGLAQIRSIDMSDPARLAAWDDRYRAFRTVLGDVAILLRTVKGAGSGDFVAESK